MAGSGDEDAFVGQSFVRGWHPVGIVCLVLVGKNAKSVTAGGGWVGLTVVTGR